MKNKAANSEKNAKLSATEEKLLFPLPDNEKKDFYYQICMFKGKDDERLEVYDRDILKEEIKHRTILVNENLPKLNGSEKQVAWANDIRNRVIRHRIELIHNSVPDTVKSHKKVIDYIKDHGVNVNNYSDCVNYALKSDKKFKKLITITSAKEIIEEWQDD